MGKRLVAAAIAVGIFCAPLPALAVTNDELLALQEAAIAAAEALEAAEQAVADLDGRIAENAERAEELAVELPGQQERAAAAIRAQYKMEQNPFGIVGVLLSAESFDEFLTIERAYLAIRDYNLEQIDGLVALHAEYEQTQAALEAERAEAEDVRTEAAAAKDAADEAVEAARAKALEEAAAAQAAYEAAIREQERSRSSANEADSADSGANGNEKSSESSDAQDSPQQTTVPTDPEVPAASGSGDWTWVAASTYGIGDGLLYSGTADGSVVTPTSMAIAMRTMPLGTVVELSYNGSTCTAVVNDRGPYYGNRQIDLQPAVAAALGFDGVGTVGYRVIG